MHGYKGFIGDVKNSFDWLIEDYSAEVVSKADPNFGEYAVEIRLDDCIILFDLDRMDLQEKFIDPATGQQYYISSVLDLLKGEEVSYPSSIKDKKDQIRTLLREYSRVLQTHLQEVLKGDFSWSQAYKEKEDRDKNLAAKVWKLPHDNPIYQKFMSGDSSWKEDILSQDI